MASDPPETKCPFCKMPPDRVDFSNDFAVAFRDRFPVSPGHTLVIPNRHVDSIFDLNAAETEGLWALVAEVRTDLVTQVGCDGFTVGINDGKCAGQMENHAQINLIPRFEGDSPDPRGGVRWVLPDAAAHWFSPPDS